MNVGTVSDPIALVGALRDAYDLRQADVGLACGVTDRTVRAWLAGRPVRPSHYGHLLALRDTVAALAETMRPGAVRYWLLAPHPGLAARSPLEAILSDPEAVMAAVLATGFVYGGEPGPFADADTEDLVGMLEQQYEQGEPFTVEVVFELAGRALAYREEGAR